MGDTSAFLTGQLKNVISITNTTQQNKILQNKIWQSFCSKQEEVLVQKCKFQSHPQQLTVGSDSSINDEREEDYDTNQDDIIPLYKRFSSGMSSTNSSNISDEETKIKTAEPSDDNCTSLAKSSFIKKKNNCANEIINENVKIRIKEGSHKKVQFNTTENISSAIKLSAADSSVNTASKVNVDQKLKTSLQKILLTLEEIRKLMEIGIDPPDGTEDLLRRKKRAAEFNSRFSRNYLYPLAGQINELLRMSKTPEKSRKNSLIQQKLIASHHVVYQALQAYLSHIPASVINAVSLKFKELLSQSLNLCEIHHEHLNLDETGSSKRESLIHIFESKCKMLLEKIQENQDVLSTASLMKSEGTKLSLVGYNVINSTIEQVRKKKSGVQSKLSMYSKSASFRNDEPWKRTIAALAKKKLQYNDITSKYKTATFKHRPLPDDKNHLGHISSKLKLTEKRSSGFFKNTPLSTPINEDDITTMVQIENEKESCASTNDLRNECNSQSREALEPMASGVKKTVSKSEMGMTKEELENNIRRLLGLVQDRDNNDGTRSTSNVLGRHESVEKLTQDMLERTLGPIQTYSPCDLTNKLLSIAKNEDNVQILESSIDGLKDDTKSKRSKKKQTITVTGERNARLICIKDEDSIIEPSENDSLPKDTSVLKDKKLVCETQADIFAATTGSLNNADNYYNHIIYKENKATLSTRTSKTNIKISRLPTTSLQQLEMLSKKNAVNIIHYKLQFYKYTKVNPLYRKSLKEQPWTVMNRISESLLDYLLLSVAREIEVNEILESLYLSEFQ